jgi:copper chaperone CopZ
MSSRVSAIFAIPAPGRDAVRCLECANRVCEALQDVPGVARVECGSTGSDVLVEFDPGRIGEAEIAHEMRQFGLELASELGHAAWRISGLD